MKERVAYYFNVHLSKATLPIFFFTCRLIEEWLPDKIIAFCW